MDVRELAAEIARRNGATESETDNLAAALEVVRREALRSGRSVRSVLSLVRVSDPPTASENLLLAAVRVLRSPHVIMPHPCKDLEEWTQRCAAIGLRETQRS